MINSKEEGIIIFDEVSMIRLRTAKLFQGVINVYEVLNEGELFELLLDEKREIRLVIMSIGYDENKGFDILAKIKEKTYDVPVFILTSNNKKQSFIRGIAEGASDYILKPFEDDYLLEKVVHLLEKKKHEVPDGNHSKNEIVFNIQSYLDTELNKAKKGNYEITILMITFFMPVNEVDSQIEKKYLQISKLFYEKFKSILWNTDILERYGSQTFFGVFPYCGMDNTIKIKDKLVESFEEVKRENKELDSFLLAISNITFPTQEAEKNAKELLFLLGSDMKKEIDELKKMNEGNEGKIKE